MAGISTGKKESKLHFTINHKRKTIWLGKVTKRDEGTWKRHVEELVAAKLQGRAPYEETSAWVAGLGDSLHKKLVGKLCKNGEYAIGLVEPRSSARKSVQKLLGGFIDSYIAERTDLEPGTKLTYTATRRNLVDFFGEMKPLADVTVGDSKDWRRWMGRSEEEGGQGLGENTVRRRCAIAKHLFAVAAEHEYIPKSPFIGLKGLTVGRKEKAFITTEAAEHILDACPDSQWRLLFALSRYAGLRCPSEHLALCWGHVDLERGRITVSSPKTKRYEGKAERVVGIDYRLRPYLEAARAELLEDFDPKRKRLSEQPLIHRYRSTEANLRTQLHKIIYRAGLIPWAGAFNACRSTFQTELADILPPHAVSAMMGNSEQVGRDFYLQLTDEHFDRLATPRKPTTIPTQPESATAGQSESVAV